MYSRRQKHKIGNGIFLQALIHQNKAIVTILLDWIP